MKLFDDQEEVLNKVRDAFRDGHRSVLLYAPTGAGKTECAISMLDATAKKFKRSAMVLDRIVLCNQTSERLQKYGINHGVMQSGHWRNRPYERIQVCSAQTLEKRGTFPGLDLAIIDECFTGDTLIETIDGKRRIDTVKDGSLIYNAIGLGTVRSVFSKTVFQTCFVRLSNGDSFECTEDHPIFTDVGWQSAGTLAIGTQLFCREDMQVLWRGNSSACNKFQKGRDHSRGGNSFQCTDVLRELLREEIEQPDAYSGASSKDESNIASHWSQAGHPWREWSGDDGYRIIHVEKTAKWVDSGICFKNTEIECTGLPTPLQAGLGFPESNALFRTGRRKPWFADPADSGCKEGCSSEGIWVESVQAQEHPCGRVVFNLRVGGHPSYYANGVLVHNCHAQRKQTTEFVRNNQHIRVIGLSASPFADGMAKTYTKVVSATTTEKLVAAKRLVPLRVFIAKEIDMAGAKKVAGEWAQGDAAERGMKITGDVVAEWVKKTTEIYGGPKKTIVFCSNVAHGADLAQKFAEAGYNFVAISYKDTDEFKADAVADFTKPDTKIHGLIACDILTKGFDVADVCIGVSARPFTKSFMSHVQQMGRVMRAHPSKDFSVWLDHSGNYLRFREDWDELYTEGVTELKDGKEKAKKEKTDLEKKQAKCPACGALWIGKADNCASCGYHRPMQNMIETVPGEMEELKGSAKKEDKQRWYSELKTLQRSRGYSDGWLSHKYKEKFGVWPKGLQDIAIPVSVEVAKWETSRCIAWAKSKKAA